MQFIIFLIEQAIEAIDALLDDVSEIEIMPFYTCDDEYVVTLCNYDVYINKTLGAWLAMHHEDYADLLKIAV